MALNIPQNLLENISQFSNLFKNTRLTVWNISGTLKNGSEHCNKQSHCLYNGCSACLGWRLTWVLNAFPTHSPRHIHLSLTEHICVILLVHKGYIIHVSLFALADRKPQTKFYTQLLSISQTQYLCLYLTSTFHAVQVDFDLIAARVLLSGFPAGSDGKESTYHAGDLGLIPGSGWSPGEGNGYALLYSCLENP